MGYQLRTLQQDLRGTDLAFWKAEEHFWLRLERQTERHFRWTSLCLLVTGTLEILFKAFTSLTCQPFATFLTLGSFSRSQGISSERCCSFLGAGLVRVVSWSSGPLHSQSLERPICSWLYPTHTSMSRRLSYWKNHRHSNPLGSTRGFESSPLLSLVLLWHLSGRQEILFNR